MKATFISQLADARPNLIIREYGDIQDKEAGKRFGVRLQKEFAYWAWRACAIANVAMILATDGLLQETLYELICEALLLDGYAFKNHKGKEDIGWKHEVLCKMLEKRGYASRRGRVSLKALQRFVERGCYVIASVKSVRGGHMVLVTDTNSTSITYNDPYTYKNAGGEQKQISLERFNEMFLERGVIAWKQ